jgi:hypothetical protein
MGNFIMGLMQLPQMIEVINNLSQKVQKLEVQVQSLMMDKQITESKKVTIVEDPVVNKKPTLKKSA